MLKTKIIQSIFTLIVFLGSLENALCEVTCKEEETGIHRFFSQKLTATKCKNHNDCSIFVATEDSDCCSSKLELIVGDPTKAKQLVDKLDSLVSKRAECWKEQEKERIKKGEAQEVCECAESSSMEDAFCIQNTCKSVYMFY